MVLSDWRKSNFNLTWINLKLHLQMNIRWNQVKKVWNVYVTDGMVEVDDLGTFTDKNKSVAISEAENYMKKH